MRSEMAWKLTLRTPQKPLVQHGDPSGQRVHGNTLAATLITVAVRNPACPDVSDAAPDHHQKANDGDEPHGADQMSGQKANMEHEAGFWHNAAGMPIVAYERSLVKMLARTDSEALVGTSSSRGAGHLQVLELAQRWKRNTVTPKTIFTFLSNSD